MYISAELKKYLQQSSKNLNSNILYTDLNHISFSATNEDDEYFNEQKISNELLSIIHNWKYSPYKKDLIMIYNLYCIPLIQNDNCCYSSQIILSICRNTKLEGLLIFYRKDRNYIPSSANLAITTKNFVEKLSNMN